MQEKSGNRSALRQSSLPVPSNVFFFFLSVITHTNSFNLSKHKFASPFSKLRKWLKLGLKLKPATICTAVPRFMAGKSCFKLRCLSQPGSFTKNIEALHLRQCPSHPLPQLLCEQAGCSLRACSRQSGPSSTRGLRRCTQSFLLCRGIEALKATSRSP